MGAVALEVGESASQVVHAMLMLLATLAGAVWLMTRLVDRWVDKCIRRRYEAMTEARDRLNDERARRGLDPFPALAEVQALAEDTARSLHPAGLRAGDTPTEGADEEQTTYGVFVVPETIPHPEATEAPLQGVFTWTRHPYFAGIADEVARRGRRLDIDWAVVLFYSSFMALFPFQSAAEIMAEVADVVQHEVQHLTDEEDHVPYARSLSRQDDLSNYWWHRKRRRHGA